MTEDHHFGPHLNLGRNGMERNDVIFVHLSALDSFVQIGTKFGKLGKLENKDDLIYCIKRL